MKIAFIASECYPFVKTGGLADVVGSLSQALADLGHKVAVILPYYQAVSSKNFEISTFFDEMCVHMGCGIEEWCSVKKGNLSKNVEVFFIESNKYFLREGLYCDSFNNDFQDTPYRFAFFSRAALQLLRDMDFRPDVIHVHDWQTAAVCAYVKTWEWGESGIGMARTVLTIHNIGYQGIYGADCLDYCGFDWKYFNSGVFEDYGRVNFLKGGIHFADFVTTVSPKYASETLDGSQSYGLAPFLKNKGDRYVGILNGVDYSVWDPKTDKTIPENYSARSFKGKNLCKKVLQQRFGLVEDENIPVIGVVSRFAYQKGLDILAKTVERIVDSMLVQFAVMGSGDNELENFFRRITAERAGKVGCFTGYSDEMSHLVEAGSDFFIMPSRYEPCGLNQIYSLKYGTLPIVRNTGGLSDTVEQYDEATGTGTGFKFDYLSPDAIFDTVGWAVSTYFDRPKHFTAMRKAAMECDFSWKNSAKEYEKIYQA